MNPEVTNKSPCFILTVAIMYFNCVPLPTKAILAVRQPQFIISKTRSTLGGSCSLVGPNRFKSTQWYLCLIPPPKPFTATRPREKAHYKYINKKLFYK